jgi:hypothetical protein
MFAGDLFREETRLTPRTSEVPAAPEAGNADARPTMFADQARRLDDLEASLSALGLELETLRDSDRVPVVTEGPEALLPDDEFRQRYEKVVREIVDQDRLDREVARVTDSLYSIIRFRGESDHEIHQHEDFLRSTAAQYMQRQKVIIEDLTPSGRWPGEDDPVHAEWLQRWRDLRAWLGGELAQVLGADSAAQLQELIEQSSYVTEW